LDFARERGLELKDRPLMPDETAAAAETKLFDILAKAGIAKITYEAFYE
jgi:hypothetical protein